MQIMLRGRNYFLDDKNMCLMFGFGPEFFIYSPPWKIPPFSDFSFVSDARNYILNHIKDTNLVPWLKDLQRRLFIVS